MRSFFILIILVLAGSILNFSHAQSDQEPSKAARNILHAYIGFDEYFFNYERNISLKSNINVRAGFGESDGYDVTGGCFNLALVKLFGKHKSHLELSGGFKYQLKKSNDPWIEPSNLNPIDPDIFLGYRYQKPMDGFVFRAGVNYPSLFNLGIGVSF